MREIRTSDGALIEARVQGSGRAPCRQTIRIAQRRTRGRPGWSLHLLGGLHLRAARRGTFAMQEHTKSAAFDPGRLRPRPTPEIVTAAEAALPSEVGAWLASLEWAEQEGSEDYPATVRKRLPYIVSTRSDAPGRTSSSSG